jgi:adenylate cyclase
MKKWIISLAFILILCAIRFTDPWFLDMVRMKALDQHQRNQTQESLSNLVTIEINNETLKKKGQWPWPRNFLSNEVIRLYQAGAALVVLPILFADEDRFGKDKALARTLKKTPTIIGQIPTIDDSNSGVTRGVSAVGKSWEGWVYQYPGALGPIPILAENAHAVGMMIIAPEGDGVVRRMPLVIAVGDELYPSISMEVLRMAAGDISYQMKTGIAGIEKLRIPKFKMIETDANGNIWLDFKWKTPTYAMHEKLPDLTGKIVIVSMTASGLDSPVPTPVGVIHSHDLIGSSLATMMTGRNITRPYWTNVAELGASFGLALVLMIVVLLLPWYFGAALMPAFIVGLFYGSSYLFTKHDLLIDWSYPVFTVFVAWAIAAFLRFMEEHKKRMEIKKQFEHYLAPAMVKKLQKNPDLLKLGGDTRELTLLFCDIRGFTPISEQFKSDPQGLTTLINRFLTPMTDIIMKNGGTIDKYMGDCIMAFWNAPLEVEQQRKMALLSSHQMLEHLDKLNVELKKENSLPINVGIGLNTGEVVVGNMGSDQRFDYSCLGDAVNLAARLEGQSKGYGVPIILGEETAKEMDKEFALVELDNIAVKGKEDAVTIYTSLGEYHILDRTMNWVMASNQHEKFLELYRQQHWDMALKYASDLRDEFDGMLADYYDIMKQRIIELKETGMPKDWDGVYRATTK